jgi:Wnt-binding factor required for Wnt secretion
LQIENELVFYIKPTPKVQKNLGF